MLPSATEHQILWEMPLARALQYEVLYYRIHLHRMCYVPGSDTDMLADIKAQMEPKGK